MKYYINKALWKLWTQTRNCILTDIVLFFKVRYRIYIYSCYKVCKCIRKVCINCSKWWKCLPDRDWIRVIWFLSFLTPCSAITIVCVTKSWPKFLRRQPRGRGGFIFTSQFHRANSTSSWPSVSGQDPMKVRNYIQELGTINPQGAVTTFFQLGPRS